MKYLLTLLFLVTFSLGLCFGQGINCEYVYGEGADCCKACRMIYRDRQGDRSDYQGSRESQVLCDSAIALCPSFADAYYVKAIPYLKRGEFITWKKLIDQAVEYDTLSYLGYRGGARFMFLRDYEGAIHDIELLKTKTNQDIQSIYNGEYHLEIIRALSYRGIGDVAKAISILKTHIEASGYAGLYGYLHLGVMFYQQNQYEEAAEMLSKEVELNDYFADTYYYLALTKKAQGNPDACRMYLEKANDFYLQGKSIPGRDSYMDYPDKIYLQQIKDELDKMRGTEDF